jgi:hypothetical protein
VFVCAGRRLAGKSSSSIVVGPYSTAYWGWANNLGGTTVWRKTTESPPRQQNLHGGEKIQKDRSWG